jgi:hypothetical protein
VLRSRSRVLAYGTLVCGHVCVCVCGKGGGHETTLHDMGVRLHLELGRGWNRAC